MRVAVVGTGIAGNVVAYRLADEHDITVFEAAPRIGGHTHTVAVEHGGREYAVDTGFIVFNERNYPRFSALLHELGVATKPSSMSFSVRDDARDFEYCGSTLGSLFAQRRNLVRPRFYRMLREVVRFNREAPKLLEADPPARGRVAAFESRELGPTLDEYLAAERYSSDFVDLYLVPMGAAIWSAEPAVLRRMPARFLVRFFAHHGMLTLGERPVWRVVEGGSRRYVDRLVARHRDRIRVATPVRRVRRLASGVEITAHGQAPERFDAVFIACHSDEALALLADPTLAERRILGAIRYQRNDVVLHTDETLLPRRRRAWAAWNYHVMPAPYAGVAVTYDMNILQGLEAPVEFCVTLNREARIDPAKVLRRFEYSHPVFDAGAVAAQRRHAQISGPRGTYYCGAYWRNGFHEDGVASALAALAQFDERICHEERHFHRAG